MRHVLVRRVVLREAAGAKRDGSRAAGGGGLADGSLDHLWVDVVNSAKRRPFIFSIR